MRTVHIVGLTTFLAALVPVLLSVGAGFYSEVQQCNQSASDMEEQLTSTLLEIEGRESRLKALLAADNVPDDATKKTYNETFISIEGGRDYGDPRFKDHTLVNLVDQYNRLLRRVQFPPDLPAELANARSGLAAIDTRKVHPALQALNFTSADVHTFADKIENDLAEVQRQQSWHKTYAPVRRCSAVQVIYSAVSDGAEPWQLIRLVKRPEGG